MRNLLFFKILISFLAVIFLAVIISSKRDTEHMFDKSLIIKDWAIMHEQSDGDIMILWPDGDNIPPARGRNWLLLKEDGTALNAYPGADDRHLGAAGTWQIDGAVLDLAIPDMHGRFEVQFIDEKLMKLKKID